MSHDVAAAEIGHAAVSPRLNRSRLNFYWDLLALLALAFTITSGLVLRLALPPGSGRLEAGAPERPVMLLWGLTRHEWGTLHFLSSLALLGVLSFHLWLHRDWLVCFIRREKSRDSGRYFGLGLLGGIALLVVALAPLGSWPVESSRGQILTQRGQPVEPGQICFSEGTILSAAQLEAATGVPRANFLAQGGSLTPGQTRRVVREYYATASPEGQKLFERHCVNCHRGPSAIVRLGADDASALERLRAARPAQAHQSLRQMTEPELLLLLAYLRAIDH